MLGLSLRNSPQSKAIAGLQLLAEKCDEWDLAVPLAFQFGNAKQDLLSFLSELRRREKQGWQALLQKVEAEQERNEAVLFLKVR